MSVLEYRPPLKVSSRCDTPGIFLAGPIQGAPDWQSRAVHIISATNNRPLHVYNPRVKDGVGQPEFNYDEQVRWEHNHLQRAREYGSIIFWLASQDPTIDYPAGRAYAQTTRFEMGRALGWLDYDKNVKIAIGVEPGYTGGNERYIHYLATSAGLKVHSDLGQLCLEAADMARARNGNG